MKRNSLCSCGSGKKFKHCHGQYKIAGHPLVFPFAARFDQLSLSSCYLSLIANNKCIGHATGFFWRHNGDVYLLTNWHVINNKDVFTGAALDGPIAPDAVDVYANFRQQFPNSPETMIAADEHRFQQRPIRIQVHESDGNPLWLQHPKCGTEHIDIAALRINPADCRFDQIVCMNDYRFGELLHLPGSNLFIIGYPLRGIEDDYQLPIWKNGTIAREPFAGWKKRPALLIDSRTSSGMSGSPVIRREFGPAVDANMSTQLGSVVTSEFVGIYSGRVIDAELTPTIGIVWWRSTIEELLSSPAAGERELCWPNERRG